LRKFDEENARDPVMELVNEREVPRELAYAGWLTEWVLKLCPQAAEELRLAARAQHLCRWHIPRDSYPMTRPGYLQWRETLKKFHAQKAGEILAEVGYPRETISRVRNLILKKNLATDAEARVLEDALCLVFLEHQFAALAHKTAEEKMIAVVQKTWAKMTAQAREIALTLAYGERERSVLEKALSARG
jgi:hypothetical protein